MRRLASASMAMWRQRRGHDVLPRMLTYIVSFNCNARCVMCDSWQKPSPNELTPGELDEILKDFPRLDIVRLTGGEPFARRDLGELAEVVRRRTDPAILHLTTNAFLTDRLVEFCEQRVKDRPLHVLISIDGFGAEHDRIRRREGAFEKAMASVTALAERREELRLQVAVNQTVVDATGLEHYRILREHLKPLGVHNHFILAYEESATYSLEESTVVEDRGERAFPAFGNFDAKELRRVIEEAIADTENYHFANRVAKRHYLRGLLERLDGAGEEIQRCVALSAHVRIYPDGTMPTCQFNSTRAGNLREQSLSELRDSETWKTQRDWVKNCQGCWAECEILPNAVYGGGIARSLR